ncbi:MAG TPA: hypothetical protein VGE84_07230 [Allosphingosinicella sp.]
MIFLGVALLTMLGAGAASGMAGDSEVDGPEPLRIAQLTIREQIIIRVPARIRNDPPPATAAPIEWIEGKGPKCVHAKTIVGAALLGQDSVDLILRDNSRIRARLENSCPALDYYYGFYISPNEDGRICVNRDVIRSRMGGKCQIEQFKSLRPAPRH